MLPETKDDFDCWKPAYIPYNHFINSILFVKYDDKVWEVPGLITKFYNNTFSDARARWLGDGLCSLGMYRILNRCTYETNMNIYFWPDLSHNDTGTAIILSANDNIFQEIRLGIINHLLPTGKIGFLFPSPDFSWPNILDEIMFPDKYGNIKNWTPGFLNQYADTIVKIRLCSLRNYGLKDIGVK